MILFLPNVRPTAVCGAATALVDLQNYWWASRESNTAPTDYESAALTKHELEARYFLQMYVAA